MQCSLSTSVYAPRASKPQLCHIFRLARPMAAHTISLFIFLLPLASMTIHKYIQYTGQSIIPAVLMTLMTIHTGGVRRRRLSRARFSTICINSSINALFNVCAGSLLASWEYSYERVFANLDGRKWKGRKAFDRSNRHEAPAARPPEEKIRWC